ncbi:MAG: hypothetical protein WAV56_03405 [Microgenomates group bacterium]
MKGQLMIEILVGLGVITTVLVFRLVAITHATRLARAARNRLEATTYAQQVLESYRNQRDLDKDAFFSGETCSPGCGTFGINGMYACTMTCTFSPAGAATQVEVEVTMSWDDGGGNMVSVKVPTALSKYDI